MKAQAEGDGPQNTRDPKQFLDAELDVCLNNKVLKAAKEEVSLHKCAGAETLESALTKSGESGADWLEMLHTAHQFDEKKFTMAFGELSPFEDAAFATYLLVCIQPAFNSLALI